MSEKSWTKAEAQQMFFLQERVTYLGHMKSLGRGSLLTLLKSTNLPTGPYSSQPKMCKNVGLGKLLSAGLCVTLLVLPDHCTD